MINKHFEINILEKKQHMVLVTIQTLGTCVSEYCNMSLWFSLVQESSYSLAINHLSSIGCLDSQLKTNDVTHLWMLPLSIYELDRFLSGSFTQ